MKIANLLEMTTPSSDPSNMGGGQAPKFGRDPHVLEDEKIEETTAGSISTGEPTNMGMQRRGKGSMFQGIKTSKKFVNSSVTEAEKDPEQEKIDSLRRSRQEKERGSERELGRDPKPTGQYYVMINGASYKKDGETVMFNSSIEAHRAIERITAFRKSKGWGTARYQVIQQKGMEEALDPKAMSALKQAKQSIAKNREADVAAWEQDFRKNFAAKYGMPPMVAQKPLNIPATNPAPKPLEKHSVLKNRLAKLNRVIDNQKYLDYLTFKAEQKGLLNPRLAADIDTSLYVKGAEKDDYEALSQKIDKSIELIKNRLNINKLAHKKSMKEEGVAEGAGSNYESLDISLVQWAKLVRERFPGVKIYRASEELGGTHTAYVGKEFVGDWDGGGDGPAGRIKKQGVADNQLEETYHGDEFYEAYGDLWYDEEMLNEAEYHGRKVQLGKPVRSSGGPKKFHVFVKDPSTGNIKKVNFGDPNMRIKKSNPARRKSFRARHNCENPGPRTSARYWSCRKW